MKYKTASVGAKQSLLNRLLRPVKSETRNDEEK